MSPMTVEGDEAARVAAAYARRDTEAARSLYTPQHPGTLFLLQALERALLGQLRRAGLLPIEGRRLLDVGCGTGDWLRTLIRWGCRPGDLAGIDLLPGRVDAARALCPAGVDLRQGDATALPYPDGAFDLVLQSTMFTSILDDGVRRRAAAEMLRVLRPGGSMIWYDFRVNNLTEVAEAAEATTQIMTMLLGSIAAVSLLVGGIGIMNIMLVSVTERTREIGIRLAIGAFGSEVMMQFLLEAIVLSTLGGVVGIVLGSVGSYFAVDALQLPFVFAPDIVVLAFAFSALVGVVFGYLPARKAAGLDPIEALRHE